MIAALFVAEDGPYINREGIDPWTLERDARKYAGPHPVIAHPPCERWGRYWSGGPSAKVRRKLGDDDGCFEAALRAVRLWGGVLEHPEATHAWKAFDLPRPNPKGKWMPRGLLSRREEWVCQVEQGHYGHPARKKTWLFYSGNQKPLDLVWGPSTGVRLDEGFHSKEERAAARARGQKPIKRLSRKQNIWTPEPFVKALIQLSLETPIAEENP